MSRKGWFENPWTYAIPRMNHPLFLGIVFKKENGNNIKRL
jgi:hypothetical protein